MRTRRFADNELIRGKERRLLQVLARREMARTLSMLPRGIVGGLSFSTPIGSNTITINAPLLALVESSAEMWTVDIATIPDPTGGFAPVEIEAGKQIGELANNTSVSLTGQPPGTYIVYAQHLPADENPETRTPPGKYAAGTGVYAEHRTFFGHSEADGTPIPREAYDDTLTPVVVSERVDRLTIGVATIGSEPSGATPLLRIAWSGSAISAVENISRVLDFSMLFAHIGAGGNAHATATANVAGFMSPQDKSLLTNATSAADSNSLVRRSGLGTFQVSPPTQPADVATKAYVDSGAGSVAEHNHDARYARYDAAQTLTGPQQAQLRANVGAAAASHNHDTLYYQKSEVASALAGKLDVGATAANSSLLASVAETAFLRTNANRTVTGSTAITFAGTSSLIVNSTLRLPVK